MNIAPKGVGGIRSSGSIHEESVANNCIQRLKHLKTLYDNELITQEDFETRKSQIVDELTGTSSGTLRHTNTNTHRRSTKTNSISFVGGTLTLDESKSENEYSEADPINICIKDNIEARVGNIDNNNKKIIKKKSKSKRRKIEVVKHGAPDWSKIRSEKAEKWIYDYLKEKWFKQQCKVKIDEVPFDKGGLRYVFHLQDLSSPKKKICRKNESRYER
eukprot:929788_1